MKTKEQLSKQLLDMKFVQTTANTFKKEVDGKMYLVDFKNKQVCRQEGEYGMTRIDNDEEDATLVKLQELCDYVVEPTSDDVPEEVKAEIVDQPTEEWYQPEPIKSVSVVEKTPQSITGIVRPAVTAGEAATAWNEYIEMRKVILHQSDFQKIQDKDFIKKSGWRKFATFYNLTDTIEEEKRIKCNDGSFIWKIKVICTAPNGRQTEGVSMCSSKEKSGARIEHDVYSTAHTRAKNRAISDMIAAGEVSAEEVQG